MNGSEQPEQPTGRGESARAGTSGPTAAGGPPAGGQPAAGWLPQDAESLFGAGAHAEDAFGLLTVDVPAESWTAALETARDTLGCTFFDWLSAVDEPGTGFRVSAHLAALPDAAGSGVRRLLMRTTVPHEAPVLPTATPVFAGAAWHERETREMFGVEFGGHPNPAPLLLPDNFEGHPLRKDFVLAARVAKAWPGAKEPGESEHGGPKRRQMLPPGVPDPNEWGPLKGQLPAVPARPARGRAGAAAGRRGTGERPVRRSRSASAGSASQREDAPTAGSAAPESPPQSQAQAERQAGDQARDQERQSQEGPRPEGQPPTRRSPRTGASDAPWHDAGQAPATGGGSGDAGEGAGTETGGGQEASRTADSDRTAHDTGRPSDSRTGGSGETTGEDRPDEQGGRPDGNGGGTGEGGV